MPGVHPVVVPNVNVGASVTPDETAFVTTCYQAYCGFVGCGWFGKRTIREDVAEQEAMEHRCGVEPPRRQAAANVAPVLEVVSDCCL